MTRKSAVNHENGLNGAICAGAQGGKKQRGFLKIDTDDDNFTHTQPRPLKARNTKVACWVRSLT